MWSCLSVRLLCIFGNYLISTLTLFDLFCHDVTGKIRSEDLTLQMMETLTKRRFDAMNQSDIDSLLFTVSKTVRRGRSFHYMWKLHGAMERETKRLDDVEDYASKDWVIQAFRPASYDENSVTFTGCASCNKTWEETRCNVTRVELLVPVVHKDLENEMINEWLSVEVNGHTTNGSRGTVAISRAVIFDLSNLLLNPDGGTEDGLLKITIKKQPCRNVFPNRSMLYEYCNIDTTILERFWSFNQRKNKSTTDLHRHDVDDSEFHSKKITNTSPRTGHLTSDKEHESKMAKGKKEMTSKPSQAMLQQTTWRMLPDTEMNETRADKSSKHFKNLVMTKGTSQITESNNHSNSSRPATTSGKARISRDVKAMFSPEPMNQKFNQSYEDQSQHSKSAKKHHNVKRQLDTPTFRDLATTTRNGACSYSIDPTKGECRRHSYYMSFQRHMNRWDIVIPDTLIDIGYCSSSCRHANHFSIVNSVLTAHAVIVNSMRGNTPPVTCSPRKMSSISILKINDVDKSSLVVENLLNAKIVSCWCT